MHSAYYAALAADEHYSTVLASFGLHRWHPRTQRLWAGEGDVDPAVRAAYNAKVAADRQLHELFEASRS